MEIDNNNNICSTEEGQDTPDTAAAAVAAVVPLSSSSPPSSPSRKPPPPPGPPTRVVAKEDTTTTTNNNNNTKTTAVEYENEEYTQQYESSTMTVAFLVTWVLPVLLLAIFNRRFADMTIPSIEIPPSENKGLSSSQRGLNNNQKMKMKKPSSSKPKKPAATTTTATNDSPSSYQEIVTTINERRRYIEGYSDQHQHHQNIPPSDSRNVVEEYTVDAATGEATRSRVTSSPNDIKQQMKTKKVSRGRANDPARQHVIGQIDALRDTYENDPENIYNAIKLADAMRYYDMTFHEGGTYEMEALELYGTIIDRANEIRDDAIDNEQPTNQISSAVPLEAFGGVPPTSINDEVALEYEQKSIDGLLCALYTARGKLYFLANMFERAVQSYNYCIHDIASDYLDAIDSRASSYIVLGKLQQAGKDYWFVIQNDARGLFVDAYTGLARVLEAKESAAPGGWDPMIEKAQNLISMYEYQLSIQPSLKQLLHTMLARLHHVLFTYNDVKTKDRTTAFEHLYKSYQYKMSLLPKWERGNELAKVQQTRQIFGAGFWPPNVGSDTRVPIFIIGFVRSGSTLLERILDAHPLIVGTGENSVFNGRLDSIRDQIVEVSMKGGMNQHEAMRQLTIKLGNQVVNEMYRRWEIIYNNTENDDNDSDKVSNTVTPLRLVDKMLTNYYTIGFIQMLYPNALILHVIREPMDTIFSAYKHDFPAGTLDYTCDFTSLAELYIAYREMIEHWDNVLPGRITHIRYDDIVHDTPGIAKAIVAATGLPWDDSVLEFHKKKHAVNTLSSTQVRKGIYKTSLQSWMKYKTQLAPLVKRVGKYIFYDKQTSLPNYKKPKKEKEEVE